MNRISKISAKPAPADLPLTDLFGFMLGLLQHVADLTGCRRDGVLDSFLQSHTLRATVGRKFSRGRTYDETHCGGTFLWLILLRHLESRRIGWTEDYDGMRIGENNEIQLGERDGREDTG